MKNWWENPTPPPPPPLNSEIRSADQENLEMGVRKEQIKKKRSEAVVHILKGEEFGLPKGWIVEQRARTNPKYFGEIDQLFYQVGSKHKFRSMKSVQNYLNECQSSNKKVQKYYQNEVESAQSDVIIYNAIPISVYFPPDITFINLTAPNTNQTYPFSTGPNSDVNVTSPPPIPQPDHDIPASCGLNIDLNSISSTDILESCWEDMNTTRSTQIPFSQILTAPSSSDNAKQKSKSQIFSFEHQTEETAPTFYDTELNCWTSNIIAEPKMKAPNFAFEHTPEAATTPIFYNTKFNCWTSDIGAKQKMKAPSSDSEHPPKETKEPNFYDTVFDCWTSNPGKELKRKDPSVAFEHPTGLTTPIFYDTEFHCGTSNI